MKITDHVHMLKIPFKIHINQDIAIDRFVNSFIIVGNQITLIDTGVAGSENLIFDYLKSIGRNPEEISLVLLSHAHPDHIGAVRTIKELTNCRVAIHEAEKEWVEDEDIQFKERPVPGFYNLVGGSCKIDFLLKDNDILEIDEYYKIHVIHCPGHSSGSTAFKLLADKILISGDAIPVKHDIPIYDDWNASLKSVKKIQKEAIDTEALLSSWDSPKEGTEISQAIYDGIKVLKSVHHAFDEIVKSDPHADITIISQKVLEKMGLPSKILNPLFLRALQNHYKYM